MIDDYTLNFIYHANSKTYFKFRAAPYLKYGQKQSAMQNAKEYAIFGPYFYFKYSDSRNIYFQFRFWAIFLLQLLRCSKSLFSIQI